MNEYISERLRRFVTDIGRITGLPDKAFVRVQTSGMIEDLAVELEATMLCCDCGELMYKACPRCDRDE